MSSIEKDRIYDINYIESIEIDKDTFEVMLKDKKNIFAYADDLRFLHGGQGTHILKILYLSPITEQKEYIWAIGELAKSIYYSIKCDADEIYEGSMAEW